MAGLAVLLDQIADMAENSADRRPEAVEDAERPISCHCSEEPFADVDRVAGDDRT